MSSLGLLIPAYNAAKLLPRLIESARAQAHPFDEIWVYDDCSTDDTAAVAERLGAHVVRGTTNRGCTYGKSVLVERTRCEWIHFHDADDLLLPNFTAVARPWMERDDVDVVALGCEERWEESREVISVAVPNDERLASDPKRELITYKINAISGLYRRSSFLSAGGFDLDPDVLYNEDQAFHCKLARAGLRFRADPAVVSLCIRQQASMSVSNAAKCLRARYHVLEKTTAEDGNRYAAELAGEFWRVAAGSAAYRDWRTADAAVKAVSRLPSRTAPPDSMLFGLLCRISPRLAIRIREASIRLLRPHLRAGYPA